jgi:uncharacterized protein (DUF2147 family)
MIQAFCRTAAVMLALMFVTAAAPANAEEFIGTWLTANSDARIRVANCGKALCGTVIWLRNAVDPKTGQPPVDDKNPNAGLRGRKILGLRIFAMEQDNTNSWTGGIYNSDDGQTYRGRLVPRGEDELEVQGCAGSLCGSEVWTKSK